MNAACYMTAACHWSLIDGLDMRADPGMLSGNADHHFYLHFLVGEGREKRYYTMVYFTNTLLLVL